MVAGAVRERLVYQITDRFRLSRRDDALGEGAALACGVAESGELLSPGVAA